jgi:hypothetical protein
MPSGHSGPIMRTLLSLVALIALTGCALPPALAIASAALSGTSYLTTGKSPSDHVLSVATDSDCDFLRALATVPRTPLCITNQPTQVAAADPEPTSPVMEPGWDLTAVAAVAPAAGPAPTVPAMNSGTMALPADAAATIAEAIARRDARAVNAALMASLVPSTSLPATPDYAAEAEISSAVIAAIAAHPEAVSTIVAAAIQAAPEHRVAIIARASAAFPGFAATISWIANQPAA